MASAILAPIAGAALRYGAGQAVSQGAKALGDTIGTFAGGKMGESVGGYNEKASDELRERARKLNVDPDAYARVAADIQDSSASRQQGRDMKMGAFANQMNRATDRANVTNQMALNDQSIAANQAQQLASAYGDAARNQAQASAAMANAFR